MLGANDEAILEYVKLFIGHNDEDESAVTILIEEDQLHFLPWKLMRWPQFRRHLPIIIKVPQTNHILRRNAQLIIAII